MSSANLDPLSRNLLIGVLALAGTLASFAATTAPIQAAQRGAYEVTLPRTLDASGRGIVSGTMWCSEGARCAAPANGERAVSLCGEVASQFGEVSRFAGPQGELGSDDLARCNAAVVRR